MLVCILSVVEIGRPALWRRGRGYGSVFLVNILGVVFFWLFGTTFGAYSCTDFCSVWTSGIMLRRACVFSIVVVHSSINVLTFAPRCCTALYVCVHAISSLSSQQCQLITSVPLFRVMYKVGVFIAASQCAATFTLTFTPTPILKHAAGRPFALFTY